MLCNNAPELAPTVSDENYRGSKEAMCAHEVWVHGGATRRRGRSKPCHTQPAPPSSSAQSARMDAHANQGSVWSRDVRAVGRLIESGLFGLLLLIGSGASHYPRDGLAAPLCMFRHTTVRLQRNKFYLIYIYIYIEHFACYVFGL